MKEQINAILIKVGLKAEEIKLEQMKLNDGETILEADAFEVGQPIFIVTPDDQKIPLPVNDPATPYTLEDGRVIQVVEEGVIASIEEVTEEVEETPEETPMATKEETQLPKSIIESVVKETKFSAEEIEAIKAELKEQILAELKEVKVEEKVEEVVEEVELQKIVPNPEKVEAPKIDFKYGQNRPKSYLDKVLDRTSK